MRRLSGERACARWEARCARLVMLWHSHLVPLVDYALIDEGRAIEAYEEHEPRSVMPRGAARIPMAIARWLRTRGLQAGDIGDSHPVRYDGRVAWRPAEDTGSELIDGDGEVHTQLIGPVRRRARAPARSSHRPVARGAARTRGVVAAIDTRGSSPVVVHVAAAPGVGATTLLAMVARESRASRAVRGMSGRAPGTARPGSAPARPLAGAALRSRCRAVSTRRRAGSPGRTAHPARRCRRRGSRCRVGIRRADAATVAAVRSGSRGLRVPRAFGRGAPRAGTTGGRISRAPRRAVARRSSRPRHWQLVEVSNGRAAAR